jgi:hypothetical protein
MALSGLYALDGIGYDGASVAEERRSLRSCAFGTEAAFINADVRKEDDVRVTDVVMISSSIPTDLWPRLRNGDQ